jgi:hypothetical protein
LSGSIGSGVKSSPPSLTTSPRSSLSQSTDCHAPVPPRCVCSVCRTPTFAAVPCEDPSMAWSYTGSAPGSFESQPAHSVLYGSTMWRMRFRSSSRLCTPSSTRTKRIAPRTPPPPWSRSSSMSAVYAVSSSVRYPVACPDTNGESVAHPFVIGRLSSCRVSRRPTTPSV